MIYAVIDTNVLVSALITYNPNLHSKEDNYGLFGV